LVLALGAGPYDRAPHVFVVGTAVLDSKTGRGYAVSTLIGRVLMQRSGIGGDAALP
jgi:hypothetical protein